MEPPWGERRARTGPKNRTGACQAPPPLLPAEGLPPARGAGPGAATRSGGGAGGAEHPSSFLGTLWVTATPSSRPGPRSPTAQACSRGAGYGPARERGGGRKINTKALAFSFEAGHQSILKQQHLREGPCGSPFQTVIPPDSNGAGWAPLRGLSPSSLWRNLAQASSSSPAPLQAGRALPQRLGYTRAATARAAPWDRDRGDSTARKEGTGLHLQGVAHAGVSLTW